jgi:hypothetical protein
VRHHWTVLTLSCLATKNNGRPRVHQSERNAGPSSILSLCCLKRDIHEFAPIVAVLTLSCLASKTNGCMLRVHPSERYKARSQSCRCVHVMISVCVLRNKLLLMQYIFFEADGKPVFQSNANQARILMFRTHNYNVRNACFGPVSRNLVNRLNVIWKIIIVHAPTRHLFLRQTTFIVTYLTNASDLALGSNPFYHNSF